MRFYPLKVDRIQYIQLDRHQAFENARIRFSILVLGTPLTY